MTDLDCIACDALTDLGASKEGWLIDNPDLLIFLDTHFVALANRSLILILHWSSSNNGGPDLDKNQVVKIRLNLSPIESENISTVEWLVFNDKVSRVFAVGTSRGYLLIYSLHGNHIHEQGKTTMSPENNDLQNQSAIGTDPEIKDEVSSSSEGHEEVEQRLTIAYSPQRPRVGGKNL
ncbi:rab3 GTPase-activating protein non-catalytic subunit [Forsythia ovata]|uniref:Rab3 GTPase-activating protein non-catalytic subunit n=1 Tax=Forsythia ovata TaxID=205694 RepID=A0ABD1S1M1_9LAMI